MFKSPKIPLILYFSCVGFWDSLSNWLFLYAVDEIKTKVELCNTLLQVHFKKVGMLKFRGKIVQSSTFPFPEHFRALSLSPNLKSK